MNLKKFVGSFFRFKQGFIVGMFENSICYGCEFKKNKGLRFIGYSFTEDEIYSAILDEDYLIDTEEGEDYWFVEDHHRDMLKKCLETDYHNFDSFQYVEESW